MKRHLLIAALTLMSITLNAQSKPQVKLASQNSTKQQKAEILIQKFMKENLNDFKSYEPISNTKIDTLKSDFSKTDSYYNLFITAGLAMDFYEKHIELAKILSKSIDSKYEVQMDSLLSIAFEITRKARLLNTEYPVVPIGWYVDHKCRSKDKSGNLKLGDWTFGFDSDVNSIIMINSSFSEGDKALSINYLITIPELNIISKEVREDQIEYITRVESLIKDMAAYLQRISEK